jgi:predicted adenylyl cyclase CyaB
VKEAILIQRGILRRKIRRSEMYGEKVGGTKMKEVEVKIIEIDRKSVEAKLRFLGASKTFDGDEVTVFFDFPGKPITAAKDLLRLRKVDDRTTLTFKKFVKNETAKVRDEQEVTVSGFEPMRLILESLGLIAIQRMERHRTSYKLKNIKVDIDKYAGEFSHIPDLMEIEGEDIDTVRSHIKLFGFQPEDCKSWTTFDLVDYYSERRTKT